MILRSEIGISRVEIKQTLILVSPTCLYKAVSCCSVDHYVS